MTGWLAPLVLLGAAAADAETPRPALSAVRLAAAPVVDGDVGEAEWAGSAVFDGRFVQLEPERGQPSRFRTVVRVGQTERALHVAFENFDPDPARLAAVGIWRFKPPFGSFQLAYQKHASSRPPASASIASLDRRADSGRRVPGLDPRV